MDAMARKREAVITYDSLGRLQTRHPCTRGHTHPCTEACDGETWVRTKSLGQGSFGRVFREECISGPPSLVGTARAVKSFAKEDPAPDVEPVGNPTDFAAAADMEWKPAPAFDFEASPPLAAGGELNREQVLEEVGIQAYAADLSTDHFPGLHYWYEDRNGKITVAMELLQGQSLHDIREKRPLHEDQVRQVMRQVLEALQLLHEAPQHLTHGDVKALNVVAASQAASTIKVKLLDFGLTEAHPDPNKPSESDLLPQRGTRVYFAPEMYRDILPRLSRLETTLFRQRVKADIWAAGILAATLLTDVEDQFELHAPGTFDFPGKLLDHVNGRGELDSTLLVHRGASPAAIDFVRVLLTPQPLDRPDATQALTHPWLHGATQSRTHFTHLTSLALHPAEPLQIASTTGSDLFILTRTALYRIELHPDRRVTAAHFVHSSTDHFTRFAVPTRFSDFLVLFTSRGRLESLHASTLTVVSSFDAADPAKPVMLPEHPVQLYNGWGPNDHRYLVTPHVGGIVAFWRLYPATGVLQPLYTHGRPTLVRYTAVGQDAEIDAVALEGGGPGQEHEPLRIWLALGGKVAPFTYDGGTRKWDMEPGEVALEYHAMGVEIWSREWKGGRFPVVKKGMGRVWVAWRDEEKVGFREVMRNEVLVLKGEAGKPPRSLRTLTGETNFDALMTALNGEGEEVMTAWFPGLKMVVTVEKGTVNVWERDKGMSIELLKDGEAIGHI